MKTLSNSAAFIFLATVITAAGQLFGAWKLDLESLLPSAVKPAPALAQGQQAAMQFAADMSASCQGAAAMVGNEINSWADADKAQTDAFHGASGKNFGPLGAEFGKAIGATQDASGNWTNPPWDAAKCKAAFQAQAAAWSN